MSDGSHGTWLDSGGVHYRRSFWTGLPVRVHYMQHIAGINGINGIPMYSNSIVI